MADVVPRRCRHCGCTEDNACRLEDGDPCCWVDLGRTVCNNPRCLRAESDRLQRLRRLNEQIQNQRERERRGRWRRTRRRRKAA